MIGIIGAFIALIMLTLVSQLSGLSAVCEGIEPDGVACNQTYLNVVLIVGTALVVFGWCLTIGFFIVRVIRRQLAFFLPIIGIVIVLAAYYLVAILLNAYVS